MGRFVFGLYIIRNPWHLEFYGGSLGDEHVLLCFIYSFFFSPLPLLKTNSKPSHTYSLLHCHPSSSATMQGRRYLDCQEEFRHPGSWIGLFFTDFVPFECKLVGVLEIFGKRFCTAFVLDFLFMIHEIFMSMIWTFEHILIQVLIIDLPFLVAYIIKD